MIANLSVPVISFDGRFLAFVFDDRGDGQAFFEVYTQDRQTGATSRVAVSVTGGPGNDSSFVPSISNDGRFVAFWSGASNLVNGDTNSVEDVFVHESADQPGSPVVNSVTRLDPDPTSADQVGFAITFSEAVSGVDPNDFLLTTTGGVLGASVSNISGSGSTRTVTVNTGTGDGTLRLDVQDNDSIRDAGLIPLGAVGAGNGNFSAGEIYTIDKSLPIVTSSLRADPNPTAADSIHFTLNFSEPVTGVDASDLTLTPSGGISGASVTAVSGSGSTYDVTAATGTGNGTIRLDVTDNDTILDAAGGHPLGGSGAGNGSFAAGEVYTIAKGLLIVTASQRGDANPTTAETVHFLVTFSQAVSGVDANDFALDITGGITAASITGASGSGNSFNIAVDTGSGDGTIRLDVIDNDTIIDGTGNPLGGAGSANGNFTTGETYTVNKSSIHIVSTTFTSNGSNDGWILESGEDSDQGGSKNNNATTFNLGDDSQDRQFRSILHFPTHYLPDNAVVTLVILAIKKQGLAGTDPFSTHQNISIDIRKGVFGSFGPFGISALQASDFQEPADRNAVGTIQNNPVGGWYWALLGNTAHPFINLTGVTQLRLGFQIGDNDDLGDDSLQFFSGNHNTLAERPHLTIEYFIP